MSGILDPSVRMMRWTRIAAGLFIGCGIVALEPARADAPAAPAPIDKAQPRDPEACAVTVIDAETKQPLAGATLSAAIDFRDVEFRTDEGGRAWIALAGRKFGKGTLQFNVWDNSHVPQERSFTNFDPAKEPIPNRVTVALWPGSETLGGKVVDEEGHPVAGAKVRLRGVLDESKNPSELFRIHVTTDAQGCWKTRAARRLRSIELFIEHPDFLSDIGLTRRMIPPPMDELRAGTNVQVMRQGNAIEGWVIDDTDQPIAGASVHWIASGQSGNVEQFPKTSTDAEGRFRFAHVNPGFVALIPGHVALIAKAPGHEPGVANIVLRPGLPPVKFRLGPGRTLAGRVVDAEGKPVAGAFVSVASWRGYRCLGVYLDTDPDGRFRWDDAPADEVDITVSLSERGYLRVRKSGVTPGREDLVFTLKPALVVKGAVRDAVTGQRIKFATIERAAIDPKSENPIWTQCEGRWVFNGILHTDLDASAAPAYRLRLSAIGYAPVVSPVFPSTAGETTWDVRLETIARTARTEDVRQP